MRYFLIVLTFILLSCNNKELDRLTQDHIQDSITIDSINHRINFCDSIAYERDLYKKISDSLKNKVFINVYKIEKAKFYLKICDKNRSQEKFLRGWIRRALE